MVTKKQHEEAKRLYKLCATGRVPNHLVKRQLIELYNKMYGTRYKTGTNCSSCLYSIFRGIKKLAETDYKNIND